jgi:hypothetical protein
MKINLVNYEMTFTNAILSKFAWKMSAELDRLGIMHAITDAPDSSYDINHHIIYSAYSHVASVNTLMVTHIDSAKKMTLLMESMKTADQGICMSQHMRDDLVAKGVLREKLSVILPAHDGDSIPIPVAILTNVYEDGRKREGMLHELAQHIDPSRFLFRIMGHGWDIAALEQRGLQVEYHPDFEPTKHAAILRNSKYYLYMGMDEGSMGTVDAKRAGLKTIATQQGFHIELGVDHPFTTQEELNAIFVGIQKSALEDWTWENYTKQHLALWEELLAARKKA